ncbi:MAG: uroporphyrinogen decarboxylase family protein [Caldicoprobacterales bacterium]|jgi:uroporphyrinogen decarboxylase
MLNKRENLLSLFKRQGYGHVPIHFELSPALVERYREETGSDMDYRDYYGFSYRDIGYPILVGQEREEFKRYYDSDLFPDAEIDLWGVGHLYISSSAVHFNRMLHPLENIEDKEEIITYPFPEFKGTSLESLEAEVNKIHERGLASVANMQCTIWEIAWYLRGIEELMVDMMTDDPKAEYLLDRVTDIRCLQAEAYTRAGADILFLGDDIGMQETILMSEDLYRSWIKPRLRKVIATAKAINPDILVIYHSCGYIYPFIPHLIEVGIDILNPIQPESMDFGEIYDMYGDRISFYGTIGTQTTMPYGSPEDVRREVFKSLSIAGDKGGLLVAPTHVLEPDVPWVNVVAYVNACRDFLS